MCWEGIGGYWGWVLRVGTAWVLSWSLCPGTAGVHSEGLKVNSFLVCKSGPEKGLKSSLNKHYRRTHGTSCAAVRKDPQQRSSPSGPLKRGDSEGVVGRPKLCSSKHSCFPVKKHRFCWECFVKSRSFPPLPVPQDLIAVSDTCLFSSLLFLAAVIPHSNRV